MHGQQVRETLALAPIRASPGTITSQRWSSQSSRRLRFLALLHLTQLEVIGPSDTLGEWGVTLCDPGINRKRTRRSLLKWI